MDNPGLAEFTDAYTLDEEDLLDVYALMLLVRTLDERVWTMNRQGKAAIVASSQGHEAGQLAAVWALRNNAPDFFCFTYYRDLAITTALGLTPEQSLLGFLAKNGEPLSGARQFPQHGAAPELKFINPSNVIGTHVPQAVGWALAVKMRKENTVVACFFGDGTTSQGEVHEAMNFASVHKLPIVFFVGEQQVRNLGARVTADGDRARLGARGGLRHAGRDGGRHGRSRVLPGGLARGAPCGPGRRPEHRRVRRRALSASYERR